MMRMEVTRRRFLELAAASAAGLATIGVSGCAQGGADAGTASQRVVPDNVVDCDVVVVGVGVAGISACVAAAETGASVVGIDRSVGVVGTNAISAVGIYGVGDPSTIGQHFNYLTSATYYQFNNRFVRKYLDTIETQVNRYISKGMSLRTVVRDASATGTGAQSVQHMYTVSGSDRAAEFDSMLGSYRNLTLHWQTEVTELLTSDGKVTGVYAKDKNESVTQYNAKGGVVICTGGFAANVDMMKSYMGGAWALVTGNSFTDGSGVKMAQAVGGQMGKNFAINATEGGALNSKASCGTNVMDADYNAMFRTILTGDVLINKRGERFVDEAIMCKKTMMFCSEPITREGGLYYGIMSQAEMDMLKTTTLADFCLKRYGFKINNAMILMFLASDTFPNIEKDAQTGIDEGWCWKGKTFEELEQKSGVPNIAATMKDYNKMCAAGQDTLLFKDPKFLLPYNEADGPFYLVENQLGLCCTQGGIRTDGDCRALDSGFNVIEGLYVAGMDADNESVPYIVGATCHGFSIGSGCIAADDAATRAGK